MIVNKKIKFMTYAIVFIALTVVYAIYNLELPLMVSKMPEPMPVPSPAPLPPGTITIEVPSPSTGVDFATVVAYPLVLYFGKKLVDIFFFYLEKRYIKIVDTNK